MPKSPALRLPFLSSLGTLGDVCLHRTLNPPPARGVAMYRRSIIFHGVLAVGLLASSTRAGWTDEPDRPVPGSVNDLSMEVAALHLLHQFRFTPEQIQLVRR